MASRYDPAMDPQTQIPPEGRNARNRYDLKELSGAFGDLGTLVPFLVAYLAIVKMDPAGVLLGFGIVMIATGLWYRTPFPVQPMKTIGTAAATQAAGIAVTPGIVVGAGLATAVIWLVLGATGLAKRLAEWIPRSTLLGVVMGLGFSFMLTGTRMMAGAPWIAAALLAFALLAHSRLPVMLLLLAAGIVMALAQRTGAGQPVRRRSSPACAGRISPGPRCRPRTCGPAPSCWPSRSFPSRSAMPCLRSPARTIACSPTGRSAERGVAISTGLANAWTSAIGGVPVCHGAGGMAGHVKFGARTGGATVMLGVLLTALALFFSDSVEVLLRLFPDPVLGVILFVAGAELALSSKEDSGEHVERFVLLTTAALTVVHVGVAVVYGILAFHASKRGWMRP